MPEHPAVRRLLAAAIVLVIIMASLVMIFSPVDEEWPQGDMPTFVSESQMRRYPAERHESRGDLFPQLTDEAGSTDNHRSRQSGAETAEDWEGQEEVGEHYIECQI
ncbi:MAG TPA: hypothetical protein VMW85_01815 [Methanomassiliicoccales archaeon]|nr:hypothetical protein [Methanomassiliicoccales archaeon]